MKLFKYYLDLGTPPICRWGPKPKKWLEEERETTKNKYRTILKQEYKRDKVIISWFSLPLRLWYLSTLSSFSSQENELLR